MTTYKVSLIIDLQLLIVFSVTTLLSNYILLKYFSAQSDSYINEDIDISDAKIDFSYNSCPF
jgi:hypothetical protein